MDDSSAQLYDLGPEYEDGLPENRPQNDPSAQWQVRAWGHLEPYNCMATRIPLIEPESFSLTMTLDPGGVQPVVLDGALTQAHTTSSVPWGVTHDWVLISLIPRPRNRIECPYVAESGQAGQPRFFSGS